MKKLLIVTAVVYGLIAASTGLFRGIDLWHSPIATDLVGEAVSAGVLWPATFWAWLT